ncbi:hypothetical protein I3760_03G100500 [Carya illinoinensis]|nr:hypothetical protein I3760_03G100500 [Carya illinoinensis]
MSVYTPCMISSYLLHAILYKNLKCRIYWQGVVIFGITVYVQTLVVRKKGPVFMTAFRPLAIVIVAIMGLFILGDVLYMGSIIGATLIVIGLYATLWGKEKEKAEIKLFQQTISDHDEAAGIEIKHEK